MVQILLIGIAAGAATALLFASIVAVASGSLLALVLVNLAPLPILIAAIGWSHLAGLVAAITAGAALALVFGSVVFIPFLVVTGIPAWWLGYLALLARPAATNGAAGAMEWYPAGRLVAWTALLAAGVVALGLLNLGFDEATVKSGLRRLFEKGIRLQLGTPADQPIEFPGVSDSGRVIDFMIAVTPSLAALVVTFTSLVNLWLAGRIVLLSGRLKRPWPDLSAITFPTAMSAVLATMVVLSFLPGLMGLVAGLFAATLLLAYAVLGLAVLHHITTGMNGRSFALAGIYALIAVFGWPIILMMLLGLVETLFDLRRRVAARRGPPGAPT
jgi:hypothetical protein